MTLKELLKAIDGTTIQKEAKAGKFIGSDIAIHADIANIADHTIDVSWFYFSHGTDDYADYIDTDNLSINIQFDISTFRSQLLSYSSYDRVLIVARLRRVSFSGAYRATYDFDLVSIRRLFTREERSRSEDRQKREAENRGCRRDLSRTLLIVLLSIAGIAVALPLFLQWVRQFSGGQIALGVIGALIVLGLLGKIFGE
jgi:hypothetical protein